MLPQIALLALALWTAWRPAEFREVGGGRGARWQLPVTPGDTLEVHTVYRQALRETFARYIVTTMSGWEHPLRHARFEIELPEGAEPVAFSFPFERCDRDGRRVWCYEAVDFRPDRDIDVSWRSSRNSLMKGSPVRAVTSSSDGHGSFGKTATTTWVDSSRSRRRSFSSSRCASSEDTSTA